MAHRIFYSKGLAEPKSWNNPSKLHTIDKVIYGPYKSLRTINPLVENMLDFKSGFF